MVRAGLVRCWNCNGFMKQEIAARYADLTTNPQKIIYSTIPLEERTDYLPARSGQVGDDSDGFTDYPADPGCASASATGE